GRLRTRLMRRVLLPYGAAGAVLSVVLYLWQGDAYVNFAEGVYLLSARLIADGATPYRDFIAAHPPLLFYTGAGILSVGDSLHFARAALALVPLATGALTAALVFRITAHRWAAVLAGLATLVAPWSLHEHATLI